MTANGGQVGSDGDGAAWRYGSECGVAFTSLTSMFLVLRCSPLFRPQCCALLFVLAVDGHVASVVISPNCFG